MSFVFGFLLALFGILSADERPVLYFKYDTADLKGVEGFRSDHHISWAELKKWDYLARRAIDEKKINFYNYTRLFTYLYTAQEEFAALSSCLNGELVGSVDPISKRVLALFVSDLTAPSRYTEDDYSNKLADIVFAKVQARFNEENGLKNKFEIPRERQSEFGAGVEVAKWLAWYACPSTDFWPPPPPSDDDPIWKKEVAEIKAAQTPMTEAKQDAIYFWAGLAYPWSGDFRSLANDYMDCQQVSVDKAITVRSLFMKAFYDTLAAYAGTKYHYLVMRPKMRDSSVEYQISVPKHPSYPAGHSAEGAVSATILSFFFPENQKRWQENALECGMSRIWAGVHYPIDDRAGRECGEKVGRKAVQEYRLAVENGKGEALK